MNQETDVFSGREEVAIVGMAGRFPEAKTIDEFWQNLCEGVSGIQRFSLEELRRSGVDEHSLSHPAYVPVGAVVEGADCFDAEFFGISPREAELMDPQQRVLLECAWEALESAGYNPGTYPGSIGVFGGVSPNTYWTHILLSRPEILAEMWPQLLRLANEKDHAITRISFKLNLKGPSVCVNTACSTTGVALHLACQSVLSGECDMALVGGARIEAPLKAGYLYEEGGILSPDGQCRAFDAEAKGTVFGNGVGMILIKRLSEALRDGDTLYAVIKGTAINNDGARKVGYAAPSMQGQSDVISEALALADVHPETIGYVETHGTGTLLGDPIEINALTQAYRRWTPRKTYCPIGSVKTNIGHLFAAAGIAGVIKTALIIAHGRIPASLLFSRPNPQIDFENSPFFVADRLREWPSNGTPRRAAVSSFGVGGTNAHILLEEAPSQPSCPSSRFEHLLVFSARTERALDDAMARFQDYLERSPAAVMADISFTLQVGRKSFRRRRVLVCRDRDDALTALKASASGRVVSGIAEGKTPEVVFMFSGQGAQYVGMGSGLYQTEKIFRDHIDRCCEMLEPEIGVDLRSLIYTGPDRADEAAELLMNTRITQPALFTFEYALAHLWMSWGIRPAAMVGHSVGEYVAAHLAGVLSLEESLSLVAARGRLIQSLPKGAMIAVSLSEQELAPRLNEGLSVAVQNGPRLSVVSGTPEAVHQLECELQRQNVAVRRLHTSHAFHSGMMEPILGAFEEFVGRVNLRPPGIPIVSTVTGRWVAPEDMVSPTYWVRNIRQTVRFSDSLKTLLEVPHRIFLEIGPGQTLSSLAKQHPHRSETHVVLASARLPQEKRPDFGVILNALGGLWLAGVPVDWQGFYGKERRRRIPLPTYAFERLRYWVRPAAHEANMPTSSNFNEEKRLSTAATSRSQEQSAKSSRSFSVYLNKSTNMNERGANRTQSLQTQSSIKKGGGTAERLASLWGKILGIEHVGLHDNYFDLGGDSLLAVNLFSQIEREFGQRLPLATLLESPTVAKQAEILNKGSQLSGWNSLVAIRKEGSRPPFFCVHAAGGNLILYRDLAKYCGSDQPFFGLQAQGLDGSKPFLTRIEDMASSYLREIRSVQPEGPYLLGGYCMGGTIAYEIAQQLFAQGQNVQLLALFETYNWAKTYPRSKWAMNFHYLQKIEYHCRNLLLADDPIAFFREKVKVAQSRKSIWYDMIRRRFIEKWLQHHDSGSTLNALWNANDSAAAVYVAKVYAGKITHFRPVKPYVLHCRQDAGWENLATGGVEVHEMAVYPAGMLVEPFVRKLAEELKDCIVRAL